MQLAILACATAREELLQKGFAATMHVTWVNSIDELLAIRADVYLDLLFKHTTDRVEQLRSLLPSLVIVNAVEQTLAEIQQPFVRINAWPGFMNRSLLEIAVTDEAVQQQAMLFFNQLQWPVQRVADEPGMVTARVISMIINEAYMTLQEAVSSKEDIDIAMKLGTNYPYGPFEWGEKIGLASVHRLLLALSANDNRYQPAAALETEVEKLKS